jgi:hypothetical protein
MFVSPRPAISRYVSIFTPFGGKKIIEPQYNITWKSNYIPRQQN